MGLPSTAKLNICEQYSGATSGSAGIDIPTADTVTILTKEMCKVPLDSYGPIGRGLSAFLIGRSRTTLRGIHVHLGLIDADYLGQIHAMVSIDDPPVTIQKGTCIAQIVPIVSSVPNTVGRSRGTGSFGSTGVPQVFWAEKVTENHPEKTCILTASGCMSIQEPYQ